MKDEEVNKIIAEYMGWTFHQFSSGVLLAKDGEIHDSSDLYTESLDALVPVWERVKFVPSFQHSKDIEWNEPTTKIDGKFRCHVREISYSDSYWSDGETIHQAAAHATAKAILALKD